MQLSAPTVIAGILPLIATLLSSWLNDDHFRPGINALIAAVAILLTATLCEWLAGGLIPGNPLASVLAIAGYVSILMNGDFGVLYTYLVNKPSPVTPKPPMPTSTQTVTTRAYTPPDPTPIVLPQSPLVPPRASATDQPTPGA